MINYCSSPTSFARTLVKTITYYGLAHMVLVAIAETSIKNTVVTYWNGYLPLTMEGGTRRQGPVIAAFKSRIWGTRGRSGSESNFHTRAPAVVGLSDTVDVTFSFQKTEKIRCKFCCGLIITSGQVYLYLRVVRLADRSLSGQAHYLVLTAASNPPVSTHEPLVTFPKISTLPCVATIGH